MPERQSARSPSWAAADLAQLAEWTVMETRRVCRPGSVKGMAVLARLAIEHDTVVWTGSDQVLRVDVRVAPTRLREWPITTHEYALPGAIQAKEHNGFDQEWDAAREREAVRGGGATQLPLAM